LPPVKPIEPIKMGNSQTMPRVDGFSPEEVSRLEKRFRKLDLVNLFPGAEIINMRILRINSAICHSV
jgi:hypothetical protein